MTDLSKMTVDKLVAYSDESINRASEVIPELARRAREADDLRAKLAEAERKLDLYRAHKCPVPAAPPAAEPKDDDDIVEAGAVKLQGDVIRRLERECADLRAKLANAERSAETKQKVIDEIHKAAAPAPPADQTLPAEKPHGHEPEPARHATGPESDPEVLRVPTPAAAPAGDQQASGRPGSPDGRETPAFGGDERRPAQAAGGEGLLRPGTFVAVGPDGWIWRVRNPLPVLTWRRATDEEIAFAPGDVPEVECSRFEAASPEVQRQHADLRVKSEEMERLLVAMRRLHDDFESRVSDPHASEAWRNVGDILGIAVPPNYEPAAPPAAEQIPLHERVTNLEGLERASYEDHRKRIAALEQWRKEQEAKPQP